MEKSLTEFYFYDSNISSYTFLLSIMILMVAVIYYLRMYTNKYLKRRNKLIEKAENYERKRSCRNDLKVLL